MKIENLPPKEIAHTKRHRSAFFIAFLGLNIPTLTCNAEQASISRAVDSLRSSYGKCLDAAFPRMTYMLALSELAPCPAKREAAACHAP